MGALTMKVKGIIDYDCHNYKLPCLTVMFPFCTLKCNALNEHPVCHNTDLLNEPNLDVSGEFIWKMYSHKNKDNPCFFYIKYC